MLAKLQIPGGKGPSKKYNFWSLFIIPDYFISSQEIIIEKHFTKKVSVKKRKEKKRKRT